MFKDFKDITKDDWLYKIEKEYRSQKSIDDLHQRFEDILEIHPFHHVTDKFPTFKIEPFSSSTRFGVHIPQKYDHREQLLHLLGRGIQLLYFDENAYWNIEEVKKIHWDYLFTIAHQDSQAARFIHDFLISKHKNTGNNLLISNAENMFYFDLESIYSGTSNLKTELEKIIHLSQNVALFITLSDHFLFNIGLLRGIKSYLLKKFQVKNHPMVIAQCKRINGTQEAVLVSETVQIISAKLSGIENILFSPDAKAWIQEYQSMIPHLLQEESHLRFSEDPISGSRYLDSISWQIFDYLNAPP